MTVGRGLAVRLDRGLVFCSVIAVLLIAAVALLALQWNAPIFAFLAAGVPATMVIFPSIIAELVTSLGIASIISASLVFLPIESESSFFSVAVRFLGVVLIGAGSAIAGSREASALVRQRFRFIAPVIGAIALPVSLYVFLATVPHGIWRVFFSYGLAGLVVLIVIVIFGTSSLASGVLRRSVLIALTSTIACSILMGIFLPERGIEQGRLRGLLDNANLLGFFAFLLGAVALLVLRRSARACLFALAVLTLAWTGSRASTLGLVVVVVLVLLARNALVRAFWLGFAGIFFVCIYLAWPPLWAWTRGLSILRTNDSRLGSVQQALSVLSASPWTGAGWANDAGPIASSPLHALANAGLPGLFAIVLLWGLLLVVSVRAGRRSLTLAIAGIIHSVFEGWLLSSIGPMLLVFILSYLVTADEDRRAKRSGVAGAPGTTE